MYIFILILALIILILSLNLKVITEYKDKKFYLEIYFGGIKLSGGKVKEKKENKPDKLKKTGETEKEKIDLDTVKKYINIFSELFSDIKKIFKYFRRKIKSDVFEIDLTFGMLDAAETGIATGVIWAAIGSFYPIIDSIIAIDEPVINVNPKFNCEYFNLEYKGVYKLKLFHIIYIGISALKLFLKYKKMIKKYGGV